MTPRQHSARRADRRRRIANHPRVAALALAGALGALGATPGTLSAQGSGEGFLFRDPVVSLGLRAGFARASAGSDIFSFTSEQLTVDRSDFDGLNFGADVGIRVSPRLDLVLGAEYMGADAPSEFRDWVDQDDLPISQSTNFKRVPLTASVKLYLTDRGRSIGRFAWIPNRYVPFVGAGGGMMWYRFRQRGDFVDFETFDVFSDEYTSTGWAPMGQGFAGLDISLGPTWVLTAQGRYAYSKATMDAADFDGFDKIDLSGFSGTLGLTVRF